MIFNPYHQQIEEGIEESLPTLGTKGILRDACEYALRNGGKRFRPALVFTVAEAISKKAEVLDAALAVEFFHTASLIADDLPCMDDEKMRRGFPCLHRSFGEATALLASYALIAAGYERICHAGASRPDLLATVLREAAYATGARGATGGQCLDLYPPSFLTKEILTDVIHKKTGALFELSFVLGWVFGGGALSSLALVKKGALHFGVAFQIADDLADLMKDMTQKREVNVALSLGEHQAHIWLEEEIREGQETMERLGLLTEKIEMLFQALTPQEATTSFSS